MEKSDHLHRILQEARDRGLFAPGVFDPRAYLIDEERIEEEWGSRTNDALVATAKGAALHNRFFGEVAASVTRGEDPQATSETTEQVRNWSAVVRKQFAGSSTIEEDARQIGQYLEFVNRKSQM